MRKWVRAFASLPVLPLIGFGLEMDCLCADRWKAWTPLLRQIKYGDLALDMEDAVAVAEGREIEPRLSMYRRMMREYLAAWRAGGRPHGGTDETNLRWHVEDMLSVRPGRDLLLMSAVGFEVLEESGMIRDRDGWWRLPAEANNQIAC